MLRPSYIVLRIQRLEGNSVDLDEKTHFEPPHQDLRSLQIQLFSSLVVKELIFLHLEWSLGHSECNRVKLNTGWESRDILNVYSEHRRKLIIISLKLNEFSCGKVQIPCRFCSKISM